MAEGDTPSGAGGQRRACTPCRGTGKVLSNLDGKPHEVSCPWCGGTGEFQPGRNAQETPAEAPGAGS